MEDMIEETWVCFIQLYTNHYVNLCYIVCRCYQGRAWFFLARWVITLFFPFGLETEFEWFSFIDICQLQMITVSIRSCCTFTMCVISSHFQGLWSSMLFEPFILLRQSWFLVVSIDQYYEYANSLMWLHRPYSHSRLPYVILNLVWRTW